MSIFFLDAIICQNREADIIAKKNDVIIFVAILLSQVYHGSDDYFGLSIEKCNHDNSLSFTDVLAEQ